MSFAIRKTTVWSSIEHRRPKVVRQAFLSSTYMLLLVTLAACGSSSYHGVTELPDINVANVTLPEVVDDKTVPSALRADEGELLALYFGFTSCPDLCPTTLANLSEARKRLGDDASRLDVALVTVDRERDTPPVLVDYLNRFGFGTDGRALRPATDAELESATKPLFATSEIETDASGHTDVGHTAWTYLINDQGTVVLEWEYGTPPGEIASDTRRVLRNGGQVNE